MSDTVSLGPRLTSDLELALADLDNYGACLIAKALDTTTLEHARAALYRISASDRRYGLAKKYEFGGDDGINQRIWNLPSRDPVFCDLAEHPLALEIVRRTIGWPALLSSMSANITGPGGASMKVHADQGYVPEPWGRALVVNIGWCIDDFTLENGATRIAVGSHRFNREPRPGELMNLTSVEAPAGSLLVVDGRLWHTNGVNHGTGRRAGIFCPYTLPIFMPQENWFLSLNPAVRQFGSETLQTLFGFRPQFMGRINGLDRI